MSSLVQPETPSRYFFGFAVTIAKWAEENPEIYNILKKNAFDEKSFVVCNFAMLEFQKEKAMILTKRNDMKSFLVSLGLNVLTVSVLQDMLEEFAKK